MNAHILMNATLSSKHEHTLMRDAQTLVKVQMTLSRQKLKLCRLCCVSVGGRPGSLLLRQLERTEAQSVPWSAEDSLAYKTKFSNVLIRLWPFCFCVKVLQ